MRTAWLTFLLSLLLPVGVAQARSGSTLSYSGRTSQGRPRSHTTAHGSRSHTRTHRNRHGHIKRSKAAKDAFKREHPCPANGRRSGPCPGYVIDHVKPLACGGADDPSNMQWQTVAEGKAKDKWERAGCK